MKGQILCRSQTINLVRIVRANSQLLRRQESGIWHTAGAYDPRTNVFRDEL